MTIPDTIVIMKEKKSNLTNLLGLAEELQLPVAWLKKQAVNGSIPCLFIGRKMRFNIEVVKKALEDIAAGGGKHAS